MSGGIFFHDEVGLNKILTTSEKLLKTRITKLFVFVPSELISKMVLALQGNVQITLQMFKAYSSTEIC